MSSKHSAQHHPYCLNCHYPLSEFDKNCSQCGQKPTDGKITLHDLLHEFTHTLFHIDGKIFSTLKHLFIPGKLTIEFFKGHHKRYAHPVQLFIVLGALFLLVVTKLTQSWEEDLQKQIETDNAKNVKKQVLANMDLTAHNLYAYQTDPSVQKAIDSLLQNEYVSINLPSNAELKKRYGQNKNKLVSQRYKLNYFYQRVLFDTTLEKGKNLKNKFGEYESDLDEFEIDSAEIVQQYGQLELIKPNDALKILENNYISYSKDTTAKKGKPPFVVSVSPIKGGEYFRLTYTPKDESEMREVVDGHIEDILENDSLHFIKKTGEGYDFTKRAALVKNKIKPNNNRVKNIIADTITEMSTKIAVKDIEELTSDEIIEKYHITGTVKKMIVKSVIEFRQRGADKMHAFISKSLWIVIFSLLPMASFMWLMYRRQKRYLVEHLVWLIHLSCLMFLLFPIFMLPDSLKGINFNIVKMVCFGAFFLLPFIAMKVYYKQSWGKTIVKGLIFNVMYSMVAITVFLFSLVLSFLFL